MERDQDLEGRIAAMELAYDSLVRTLESDFDRFDLITRLRQQESTNSAAGYSATVEGLRRIRERLDL